MTDLTLRDPDASMLKAFGDAALKLSKLDAAISFYRAAVNRTKGSPLPLLARIGLAQVPTRRTLPMLEALQAIERTDPAIPFISDGLATWLKSPPFARDIRFLKLADDHANLLPVPNWHWNLNTAVWAVEQARQVEGEFVELGVFKGHTTRFVADYVGFGDWPKTWFLYDTFEGIPQDQTDPGWESANAQAYYEGSYSFEEVRERFAEYPNIRVIKGRVPEILGEVCPDRIAFMHVDLNNATAEIQALDLLFDRISPGGVILFDDFCWAASIRQQLDEIAWFEARGLKVLALPTGQGLFVKR